MKLLRFQRFLILGGLWPGARGAIVPVTGVHTGIDPATGACPPRLRIQDLQTSGPQWDLYIQAMVAFQGVSEDDDLSYFRLSGIHGRPYVAWNGVEQVPGAPVTGYCTHNEVLFAIWHRPMVAVFEQVLAGHVQAVAARYNGTQAVADTYRKAADAWRHPYWDWAVDKALPDAVVSPNVTIRVPSKDNGTGDGLTTKTIANPLRFYRFHQFPLNTTLFPPGVDEDYHLDTYPETLRCPDPYNNFTSNPGMASANVATIDLAAQVYNIYARVADFGAMSSTACDSTSFEQEHNEIHVAVGGLHPMGHFAHLGYSGFDPLFMMHHTAIDRHVALWQAIHANASMFGADENYAAPAGQYATAPGTNITADSPLKPFYAMADGKFHTGNSARDVATFGYTYPELLAAQATVGGVNGQMSVNGSVVASGRGSNSSSGNYIPNALSRAVTAEINRLYGPTTSTVGKTPATAKQRSVTPSATKAYFVRVGIEKAGLPLPAAVHVFLGATLAGRLLLLASPPRGRVHGEISLQGVLHAAAERDVTNGGEAAEGFVRQHFRWEVATLSGDTIQLPDAHDMTVQVREEDVRLPGSVEEFPVYSNVRVLHGLGTE